MAYAIESHRDVSSRRSGLKKFHLIWLAHNVDKLKKDFSQAFSGLQNITETMETFSDADICMNYIFESEQRKIIMIVPGAMGENTVPIVHDASHLDSIFVFCHDVTRHQQWTKNWSKIKGVFDNIDTMYEAVKQVVQQMEPERSRPTTLLPELPSVVHRPLTPQSTRRVSDQDKTTAVDDQQRELDRRQHRHRTRSTAPIRVETDEIVSRQTTVEPPYKEKETSKAIVMDNQRNPSTDHSTSRITLTNSMSSTTVNPLSSQQLLPSNLEQLQKTLIATTERGIRASLLQNNGTFGTASLNIEAIDRLQDTLVQTIGKRVSPKIDNSNELNRLFADLKQTLIDTMIQQQPMLLQDIIKQTVEDALKQQMKSVPSAIITTNATTVTGLTKNRKAITIAANREVRIIADAKKTRTDAAFRQQRDTVVANKRFRDIVSQWFTVSSMADLAVLIKANGTNDLECAWLLFCWIGQNIRYAAHCNNNAAESVLRTRQGVCRGFASLYHECCSLLGIQCSEISGYAKNNIVKSTEELKQSSHAWNSIVLDDHTYLVDPTWGAGGRDDENKLEEFYFLTSPEEFIYTHFSIGSQLLDPEISKATFLTLPIMKSLYYQLGLHILSPKQGYNEINANLFKISIRTPKNVDLSASLKVGHEQYPRNLHTLCQRDETNLDVYNCYIAPPVDGLYDIDIYAKTTKEETYRDAIRMRLRVSNIADAFTFPRTYLSFTEHNCILIEPLQGLVHQNEELLIHMMIPNGNVIKIQNGDDYIVPNKDEFKRGLLKKTVRVEGDVQICARWDANADTISIICTFYMI